MNKDILHRIKSVRQTVQISNAQKLVAASHIGKARRLLADAKPYHDNVSRSIANVLYYCPELESPYIDKTEHSPKKTGVLVLSANKGLAGGFNSNIVRFAEESLTEKPAEYIIVMGRADPYMIKKGFPVDTEYDQPLEPPKMFTARELAEKVVSMLESGKLEAFDIIHTKYRSSIKMEVVRRRLYPLRPVQFTEIFTSYTGAAACIFEPSPETVMSAMMLKYLKGYIYGCLVHTWICELTSRVTAMDNAIRNGNEMLEALTLTYNRARQAAITQEITEIVAGAAAMNE